MTGDWVGLLLANWLLASINHDHYHSDLWLTVHGPDHLMVESLTRQSYNWWRWWENNSVPRQYANNIYLFDSLHASYNDSLPAKFSIKSGLKVAGCVNSDLPPGWGFSRLKPGLANRKNTTRISGWWLYWYAWHRSIIQEIREKTSQYIGCWISLLTSVMKVSQSPR